MVLRKRERLPLSPGGRGVITVHGQAATCPGGGRRISGCGAGGYRRRSRRARPAATARPQLVRLRDRGYHHHAAWIRLCPHNTVTCTHAPRTRSTHADGGMGNLPCGISPTDDGMWCRRRSQQPSHADQPPASGVTSRLMFDATAGTNLLRARVVAGGRPSGADAS